MKSYIAEKSSQLLKNAITSRLLLSSSSAHVDADSDSPAYDDFEDYDYRHLTAIQITTSSISFLSSLIIVVSISWCGSIGLSTPYRRIIFGLSVADILQSLALLAGPSAIPPDGMSHAYAYGDDAMAMDGHDSDETNNDHNEVMSCRINGFFFAVGASAVMMYTLLLCTYYLCKLKWRMTDDRFKNKVETKSHAFIVLYCLVVNIAASAKNAFHTIPVFRSFCALAYVPTGCHMNDHVDCDEESFLQIRIFMFLILFALPGICFLGIVITMGMLYRHGLMTYRTIEMEVSVPTSLRNGSGGVGGGKDKATDDEKAGGALSSGGEGRGLLVEGEEKEVSASTSAPAPAPAPEGNREKEDATITTNHHKNLGTSIITTNTTTTQDKVQEISRLYRKETMIQASCYVGAFCITYIPLIVCFTTTNFTKTYPHAFIPTMAIFFYPLGGFLNILVYCRPKVANIQRNHPTCSKLRGFWMVIKAGGEIPDDIDLTESICQNCCRPPAWALESDYLYDETDGFGSQRSRVDTAVQYERNLRRLGFGL